MSFLCQNELAVVLIEHFELDRSVISLALVVNSFLSHTHPSTLLEASSFSRARTLALSQAFSLIREAQSWEMLAAVHRFGDF